MCSETGACPPGMVCDPADNLCRAEVEPECGMDSDCATGVCDQSTGVCVAGCRAETCTAGPCETARCEGDTCVVESLCGNDEMCCAGECVAAGCADSDPSTDDACGASGCEHTPNTGAACDDAVYCNGADTYVEGLCEGHAGNPCAAPLTCDEDIDMCVSCSANVPCPETELGPWSECGGFGGACDGSGTRSRTVITYACQNSMCVPTERIETETCTRTTEGVTCGSVMYGSWGACGGFADTCDEGGRQERSVTAYTCVSEVCAPMTTSESQACTRTTSGVTCQATDYGAWGSCMGYGDTCDESGTRTRDVSTYACANQSCMPSMSTESETCGRSTDGVTCAPDDYGSWSACGGYSSTCDESGTRSRNVTSHSCGSEACGGTTGTETGACSRDTDGISCGSAGCNAWGTCGGYSSVCDETGTQSRACTNPTCVTGSCDSGSYTDSRSCNRDTDGTSCGTVTCGAWSTCSGYSSTCDETGTQTRTCSAPQCSAGGCVSTSYTESRSCNRDTDNTTCGSTTCTIWGVCSGFSSACDETGSQTRTCSTPVCAAGSCSGSTSATESQGCLRDTDGNACLSSPDGPGQCLSGRCSVLQGCNSGSRCTSSPDCGPDGYCTSQSTCVCL